MTVSSRYGARAAEYCEALGSLDQMEPTDIALITSWGASVPGSILDAGCGPGHWARLLASADRSVTGIDVTPEFIAHARDASSAPNLSFEVMDMAHTPYTDGSFCGNSRLVFAHSHTASSPYRHTHRVLSAVDSGRKPSSGDVSGRPRIALRTRSDNRLLCEHSRVFRTVREGRVYGGRSSHPQHREAPRPPGNSSVQARVIQKC